MYPLLLHSAACCVKKLHIFQVKCLVIMTVCPGGCKHFCITILTNVHQGDTNNMVYMGLR